MRRQPREGGENKNSRKEKACRWDDEEREIQQFIKVQTADKTLSAASVSSVTENRKRLPCVAAAGPAVFGSLALVGIKMSVFISSLAFSWVKACMQFTYCVLWGFKAHCSSSSRHHRQELGDLAVGTTDLLHERVVKAVDVWGSCQTIQH